MNQRGMFRRGRVRRVGPRRGVGMPRHGGVRCAAARFGEARPSVRLRVEWKPDEEIFARTVVGTLLVALYLLMAATF